MAEYVNPGIETDPTALTEQSFEDLADRLPGWAAIPTEPDTVILEETGAMAADVRDVASEVMTDIFRFFGPTASLPPVAESQATVPSTWVAPDTAGYTVQAGWRVGIPAAGDEMLEFEVQASVVISPGSSSTAAGGVTLVQVDGSADGNGLGGNGVQVQLIDSVPYLFTVTLTAATSGGADEESDEDYLDRLASELALQSPRPILPDDFAVLARRVTGVDRALAIDLYKPVDVPYLGSPADSNRPRSVTLALVDDDGAAVSGGVKTAVDALLQAMREVNFEVWIIDPTYTTIDVSFTATAYPGYDAPTVQAAAEAAVEDYLSAATWGLLPYSDERVWVSDDKVRYLEIAEALNRVDGLRYVTALTIGPGGGPMGTTDVTLSGVAPMPVAGVVSGTVS